MQNSGSLVEEIKNSAEKLDNVDITVNTETSEQDAPSRTPIDFSALESELQNKENTIDFSALEAEIQNKENTIDFDAFVQKDGSIDVIQKPAPVPVPQVPEKEDSSFWADVLDVASAPFNAFNKSIINNTLVDTANGALNLSEAVSNFAVDVWNKGFDEAKWNWKSIEERSLIPDYPVREQTTDAGKVVESISQVAFSLYGAGKVLKAGNVLQQASAGIRFPVQGFLADFFGFGKEDGNLSSMLKNAYGMDNKLVNYLVIEADDSEVEARLKNGAEGLLLGGVVDKLVSPILKFARKAWRAPDEEAVNAALREFTENMDEDALRAVSSPKNQAEEVQAPLSAKAYKEIIDNAKTKERAVERITNTMNLKQMIFDSPHASHTVMDLGEKLFEHTLKGQGPERHAEVFADMIKEAKRLGDDVTDIVIKAGNDVELIGSIGKRLGIAKNMYHVMTEEALKTARKIDSGVATDKEYAYFLTLSDNIQNTHKYIADMRTSFGRALGYGRMKVNKKTAEKIFEDGKTNLARRWVSTGNIDDTTAKAWLEEKGVNSSDGIQAIKEKAKQIILSDTLETRIKNMSVPKDDRGRYVIKAGSELFINNLLSSPLTHTFNAVSSLVKSFDSPVSKISGGVLYRDSDTVKRGARELMGMALFAKDAIKLGVQALKLNDNILLKDAGRAADTGTIYRTLSKEGFKNSEWYKEGSENYEIISNIVEIVGKAIGLPSRIMTATDEIFKQLAFRASTYAELYAEAEAKGLNGSLLDDYIDEAFKKRITAEGRAIIKNETAYAVQKAKEATWTQSSGDFVHWMQSGTNRFPLLKFFLPFIRTPTNMAYDVIDHAAVWRLFYKNAVSDVNQAEQAGRILLGGITAGIGYLLYNQGRLNGGAPVNAKERDAFYKAGNQPYALKVGDTWVSFERLGPVGIFLGMAADVYSLNDRENYFYDEDRENSWFNNQMLAILRNFTSKTFLSGLGDLVDILDTKPGSLDKTLGNILVNTTVPYSGFVRYVRNNTDPVVRAAESFGDKYKDLIPFLSDTLPARINHVTGEPLYKRGYVLNEAVNDSVLEELHKLGGNIIGAPSKKSVSGVDLNMEQLERLKYHEGTVKIGGKTKYERLKSLMESESYNQAGYALQGFQGKREKAVNKITQKYRARAVKELLKEYPELKQKRDEIRNLTRFNRTGAVDRSTAREEIAGLL